MVSQRALDTIYPLHFLFYLSIFFFVVSYMQSDLFNYFEFLIQELM